MASIPPAKLGLYFHPKYKELSEGLLGYWHCAIAESKRLSCRIYSILSNVYVFS